MNYLDIEKDKLVPVVKELNILLADYHVYYQKLRNFHWNILGKNFFDLHNKFEEMYDDTKTKIDEVAERIITLKYHPVSNLSDYLEISKVKESTPLLKDTEMIDIIIEDHRVIIEQLNKVVDKADKANDEGTIDLIGAYIRELEKSTWMLNAWAQKTDNQLDTSFVK